jgi:hypothetical protein
VHGFYREITADQNVVQSRLRQMAVECAERSMIAQPRLHVVDALAKDAPWR